MTPDVTYGSPGRVWMRQAAELEDRHESVAIGGLASEFGMLECASDEGPKVLGRLVEWRRRQLGLSEEELAKRAGLGLSDVRAIEQDDEAAIKRAMMIHKVAEALDLPSHRLAILAGLASVRDEAFAQATLRFAAKSSTAELSKEQRRVLEEYVKVLLQNSAGV